MPEEQGKGPKPESGLSKGFFGKADKNGKKKGK